MKIRIQWSENRLYQEEIDMDDLTAFIKDGVLQEEMNNIKLSQAAIEYCKHQYEIGHSEDYDIKDFYIDYFENAETNQSIDDEIISTEPDDEVEACQELLCLLKDS